MAVKSDPGPIRLVDVSQLTTVDAAFVDLAEVDGRPIEWSRHSGLPQSAIERLVTRPALSRYRAAWAGARDALNATAVISHLPYTTASVADVFRLLGVRKPHLAFSFNFTNIPDANERRRFHRRFSAVDQFTVYTEYEAGLYADAFGLPVERFRQVDWTQDTPSVAPVDLASLPSKPFVAAVGGEGRDFATLVAAARALPHVPFVVIARPDPVFADAPANMRVLFNIPFEMCWGIASRAAGLLVPLKSSTTCCGHITLISGRLLGLPIVTTRSLGTREYSEGFDATTLVEPQDVDGWVAAIEQLIADPAGAATAAAREVEPATARHDRGRWSEYVADFVHRF